MAARHLRVLDLDSVALPADIQRCADGDTPCGSAWYTNLNDVLSHGSLFLFPSSHVASPVVTEWGNESDAAYMESVRIGDSGVFGEIYCAHAGAVARALHLLEYPVEPSKRDRARDQDPTPHGRLEPSDGGLQLMDHIDGRGRSH